MANLARSVCGRRCGVSVCPSGSRGKSRANGLKTPPVWRKTRDPWGKTPAPWRVQSHRGFFQTARVFSQSNRIFFLNCVVLSLSGRVLFQMGRVLSQWKQVLLVLSRNHAVDGAPPFWRRTAWPVREGDSHPCFWFTFPGRFCAMEKARPRPI